MIVRMDSKGRVLIPLEVRSRLKSNLLSLEVEGDRIILTPLPSVRRLRGLIKVEVSVEEAEKRVEEFIRAGLIEEVAEGVSP